MPIMWMLRGRNAGGEHVRRSYYTRHLVDPEDANNVSTVMLSMDGVFECNRSRLADSSQFVVEVLVLDNPNRHAEAFRHKARIASEADWNEFANRSLSNALNVARAIACLPCASE